jgi:hypothetical protein
LRRTLDILTFPISLPSSKRLKTDGNIETLRIFNASLSSRSKKTKSGFLSGFPGVQESRARCGPYRQRIKPFSSETAPTRLAVPAAIRLTNLMPFAIISGGGGKTLGAFETSISERAATSSLHQVAGVRFDHQPDFLARGQFQ